MIFGIGIDVVQVQRVAKTYARFGQHFVDRLLMDEERVFFARSKNPVRFLSMRFAAKEAVVKAMGTGFSNGMWIRDVGTVPNKLGRPDVIYSTRGQGMCRQLGISGGHLSLTDEAGLVVAFAVLERIGGDQ